MNGKTVVITGASSGIDFGVAEAYFGQDAKIVLNGRDEAKLTEAAERFGDPQRIAVVPGDIGPFSALFGSPASASDQAVPEPTTLSLAVVLLLGLAIRQQRRV